MLHNSKKAKRPPMHETWEVFSGKRQEARFNSAVDINRGESDACAPPDSRDVCHLTTELQSDSVPKITEKQGHATVKSVSTSGIEQRNMMILLCSDVNVDRARRSLHGVLVNPHTPAYTHNPTVPCSILIDNFELRARPKLGMHYSMESRKGELRTYMR
jgi:hypothetical protein